MKIQDAERVLRKRSYRRLLTPDAMIALGVLICLAVLILFVVGTFTNFIPSASEIKEAQASMQAALDQMSEDLTKVSEEVAAWPGITVATTETTKTPEPEPSIEEPSVNRGMVEPEPVDEWLLKITALECDGSYEGALGVATVILNRLENGWGDTIFDVISAPGQFSVYGSKRKPPITDTVISACEDALAGIRAFGPEVQYFCTPKAYERSSFFQTLEVVDRYAGTVWCREVRR